MSNRKTTAEQIEAAKLKIEQEKVRMQELVQKHKKEERKKRTRRLIERGAIVESLIPEPEALTNEQVQSFLAKTIKTEFARKILKEVQAQEPAPNAEQQDKADTAKNSEAPTHKPTAASQSSGKGTQQDTSNSAGQAV